MDGETTEVRAADETMRPALTLARLIEAVETPNVKRWLSNVYVSRKFDYVFVSNPKAACSSIKHKLFELESPSSVKWRGKVSVHAHEFSPLLGLAHFLDDEAEAGRPRRSFCIVRNPFTRLFSAHTDKIRRDSSHKGQIARALGLPPSTPGVEIGFADFVRAIASMDDDALDGHWGVQTQRLALDRFAYDFVGAFERLDEDLSRALVPAGVPAEALSALPRRNRTRPDTTLADVLDDATADLIRKKYAADFRLLGYSEDPAEASAPPTLTGL